ncbi:MAG: hypothetical protein A2X28_01055 [Elusimicrobia bacterium GWA2_56_46]|nr:MAG: hypothetical protein A2X28_01055 [Elusimicrobia bacterium GWA2_56_46]OGR54003.1 MAG: hypothetical protein A2X39_09915 [Elusimicrobia bacterium GWC2_56_31]HBB67164.1 hypothetical protein [Elusimicrobiota bacterium]HBW22113.1 hypothetical protein [Elusimicrobiota bacterium]
MMDSAWSAAAWGAAFGTLNGWTARRALRSALDKPDKVFYAVFTAGFLWRLLFLVGAVWLLRDKKYIILLPFSGVLIFTQFMFEAVPLRKHGTKDNT